MSNLTPARPPNARELIRTQVQLLAKDRADIHNLNDHAWDTGSPVTAATERL